jgi:5-bromo-4-chloroindolyl phosphate hydrolysis protein
VAQASNIGDQIGDAIQDALDHQDFTKIRNMVWQGTNYAARSMGEGISQAAEASRRMHEEHLRVQAEQQREYERQREIARVSPTRFANVRDSKIAGILMLVLGGVFFVGFGLSAGAAFAVTAVGHFAILGASSVALLALTGASAAVAAIGGVRTAATSRFARYRDAIGASESVSLNDLAHRTGRALKSVKKDVSKMIKKGMFLQAHVDEDTDTLFLTDASYADFQRRQAAAAEEKRREFLRQQAASKRSKERPLSADEQKTLNEGRNLLQQVDARISHVGSDDVAKKAMAICQVADSIFKRAEQDPDVIENLDQMVDYYLPLTIKLLDTYTELAAQPIQSQEIGASRREIEDTLDTLVRAYVKLYDSLFREMIWDASTDISVLKAVLAQDGLTDGPFDKRTGENNG